MNDDEQELKSLQNFCIQNPFVLCVCVCYDSLSLSLTHTHSVLGVIDSAGGFLEASTSFVNRGMHFNDFIHLIHPSFYLFSFYSILFFLGASFIVGRLTIIQLK